MKRSVRSGVFMLFFATSLLVAQNARTYLEIQPRPTDPTMPLVVEIGKTVHFTVTGYQFTGANLPPTKLPVTNVDWLVDPPNFGMITPDGDFTFSSPSNPSATPVGKIIARGDAAGMRLEDAIPVVIGILPPPGNDWTITGSVTDGANMPVANAQITAMNYITMNAGVFNSHTDPQGNYSLKVPAGSWVVSAIAPGFLTQYFDHASTPDQGTKVVTVPGQMTIADINFSLHPGGSISGRVLDASTNDPLPQAKVVASFTLGSSPGNLITMSVGTDRSGNYRIDGLPSGVYRVQALAPGYESLYYNGKTNPGSADSVSVQNGASVSNIDFLLQQAVIVPHNPFAITGTVRDDNGNPIAHAVVSAENPLSMQPLPNPFMTKAGADGKYFLNVPGGVFIVRADAPGFLGEYFDNVKTPDKATMLTLNQNDTLKSNIDFSLGTGGTISGVVLRASDNSPVAKAWVSIMQSSTTRPPTNGSPGGFGVYTDSAGAYSITGLTTGKYVVFAQLDGYALQYYDKTEDASLATKVDVVEGQTTPGINFALIVPPAVTGTVRDAANAPIPFAMVYAQSVPLTPTQPIFSFTVKTDQNGAYRIIVPPGKYILQAMATGHSSQWYNHAAQPDSATQVVMASADVNGIDFALGDGGVITGVVTKSGGAPLQDAMVSIMFDKSNRPPDPSVNYGAVRTDSTGMYRISGLGAGSYYVTAHMDGYADQFYDNATDPASATKVVVADGQTTSGIDFELYKLPGISGVVTDQATTLPIAKAQVVVDGPNAHFMAFTDQNGAYTLGLPPGTYKVRAVAPTYATEWYNEKADAANADDVIVSAGVSPSGIDFTLSSWGGRITGVVTDELSAPIANAQVRAWAAPDTTKSPTSQRPFFMSVQTAADGSYDLKGLPPGSYYVMAGGAGYLAEFYDNAPDVRTATQVSIANSQVASGINFALARGGSISGVVTDAATTLPVPYAFVTVRGSANATELGARTDQSGVYTIEGLATGDYVVLAVAPKYIGEFYNNVQDPALATPVTVTAPSTSSGIDFALTPAPPKHLRYSGTVQDANNGSPLAFTVVEAIDPAKGQSLMTSTDANGRYEFTTDAASLVRARAIGYIGLYAGSSKNWEEGAKASNAAFSTFALTPENESGFSTLFGRVLDSQSKKAVPNAWVYGTDAYGDEFFDYTDGSGRFAMGGLSDGAMNISVSGVQYAPTQGGASVVGGSGSTEVNAQRNESTLGTGNVPAIPSRVALAQNYPNPFNPSTTVSYSVPSPGLVTLRVYNLLGQPVATLVNAVTDAGMHSATWNATTAPSGLYMYRLETNGVVLTRRMTLLK